MEEVALYFKAPERVSGKPQGKFGKYILSPGGHLRPELG